MARSAAAAAAVAVVVVPKVQIICSSTRRCCRCRCCFFVSFYLRFFRTCRCILIFVVRLCFLLVFFFHRFCCFLFVPAFAIKKNILILTSGYCCTQQGEWQGRSPGGVASRNPAGMQNKLQYAKIFSRFSCLLRVRGSPCLSPSLSFSFAVCFVAHSEFYFIVHFFHCV